MIVDETNSSVLAKEWNGGGAPLFPRTNTLDVVRRMCQNPKYAQICFDVENNHCSLSIFWLEHCNRYGRSKPNWLDIDRDELLTFLGLITMMGIKKLPRIENYWRQFGQTCILNSTPHHADPVPNVQNHITFRTHFNSLILFSFIIYTWWEECLKSYCLPLSGNGFTRKFKPILDVLSRTFLSNYSPSQELSVDEAMIKYKGHIRGKVRMPNKPIKAGFKVWCCCCSCCGYLCTFQVYEGKPIDPATGKIDIWKGNGRSSCQGLGRPIIRFESCTSHG